jgi:acetyl esterase/lipase
VPIGYLWTTLVVAWCTAFAVAARPARRPTPGNLSYWSAFLLNELPFLAFYWLLASTLLAASEGDLSSPVGWIALALAVATTLALAVVVRRAMQTRNAVERALAEAGLPQRRSRLPLARVLVAPFSRRRRDVERIANVAYGDAGKWNLLDVYRHRSHPQACPTFVHLHGGAFRSGRKNREARLLLYRLAGAGWLCISANYRLGGGARFPDHLVDVKKVIAWVRAHGPEYGADPSVVVVAGSSAGGNLASTAALTPNAPRFQPGFEQADTSVTAAVCLYGYLGDYHHGDDPDGSSPFRFVNPDAPPFFVAHGDRDTLVPAADAHAFAESLRATTPSPIVYAELPGAHHTFDLFRSLRFERVVDGVEAFADWAASRSRAS